MGIVGIGAVFVDIKGYPLSTYIPGGRNAGRVEQVHGGVCRNVAEDIANVELRPTFVSLVDDTGSGQDVIDKLARHKVNTRYIQRMPDGMGTWLAANVRSANIPCMVVTMGEQGAVYSRTDGESGMVPAKKVDVIDTTGAGDAFFAGTVIGLTYGKTLAEACEIGSRLAASVICISENVCPRFRPQEFGLDVPVTD